MTKRLLLGAAVPVLWLTAAGCGSDDSAGSDTTAPTDRLRVSAAFFPLEEAARAVGGDLANVDGVTPVGQGPHDVQLDPTQVEDIEAADLVFYLGRGFQPQVEDAVANAGDDTGVDLLDSVELLPVDPQLDGTQGEVDGEVLAGDVDPHVWLDPVRMIAIVEEMVTRYSATDPANADVYRANADAYLDGLDGLDAEYRTAMADCESRVIVTSHRAFGYLADSYDLRQIPIAGISPEEEPDPRTLEAIASEAEAEGVATIFLEETAPPDLAQTVASEIGADLSLLDPIEGVTQESLDAGTGYAQIMRENLARLVTGLRCSA
jgi:zinc transport system substrate-binding protein